MIAKLAAAATAATLLHGAALAVVAAGGWWAWAQTPPPALAGRRIAVAPFENRSGDAQLDDVLQCPPRRQPQPIDRGSFILFQSAQRTVQMYVSHMDKLH